MSHSGKINSEGGLSTLADRFKKSLKYDHKRNDNDNNGDVNKPDFRDLGSPVSPLRPNAVATSSRSSSSSSSSSGSFSGRNDQNPVPKKSDSGSTTTNSGELSGPGRNSPTFSGRVKKQPVTRSSDSGGSQMTYSGGGSVSSPPANALPAGNICPSGKILKADVSVGRSSRPDVLGTGRGHYGHGSIMRGGGSVKFDGGSGSGGAGNSRGGELGGKGGMCGDGEDMKRLGNEEYKRGHFSEALSFYDRAIAILPENAACHYNKAAALIGLKRLGMAVRECEEVLRLDPGYVRAHHRLGSLYLCLGQVENARRHICFTGIQPDPIELQNLQAVEKHVSKCTIARRIGDWKVVLKEADAAIASGAAASPQLFACRAEALLKLRQYADAELSISNSPKVGTSSLSCSQTKFFGMLSEAYVLLVCSQIDMSMGRFDSAVTSVEKAAQIDPQSAEVSTLLNNVRAVARARTRGNDLFKSERFTEATAAYGEGLRLNPSSSVLYCNRAACWYKLGQWERSIDDCNQALDIQPNYTKALLRRAASNSKLERWVEAVRDYEVLRKELPNDNDVAEALFHAQVGLKKSRGEEVHNMKFGGDVELVSGLDQFRAAISSPSASVVHFKSASDLQCNQISPFVDSLCSRYPSINFLKVDVRDSPAIANAENVKLVPTFKIYKNGSRIKEMICPSQEVLESSVRHYSF
ncbi:Tetratricopetide-repeat thioredoxin-like 1 [Heracleum sosnowskyi]|uniref:Tetratricopetide-repeat thioredoxin-like 1 n=1 Tax=Heracleum sosnowskyi TaxID=360622 RepID=A0AAD8JKT6_9APIA|nr:Tetratricopetide-repeat thioredoxin-like 1 [Heracleum sosnowskyi]